MVAVVILLALMKKQCQVKHFDTSKPTNAFGFAKIAWANGCPKMVVIM